jgi:hypothetical protein
VARLSSSFLLLLARVAWRPAPPPVGSVSDRAMERWALLFHLLYDRNASL